MNKTLIFLIISTSILVLSAIVICIAPIINNIKVKNEDDNWTWEPSDWGNLNCQFFADREKSDSVSLDDIQKMRKFKNLCYGQKAMYGLEYSAFIINSILSFVCAYLTLLHYLNVGKDFEKKTGLIGLFSGIIGFILTFVYVCYSGYIFNNDRAYGILKIDTTNFPYEVSLKGGIKKLYPNGASRKKIGTFMYIYENEIDENLQYIKYKDLGKKQYNYDSEYYETYKKNGNNDCKSGSNTLCNYIFEDNPTYSVENKYIYDRWLTALILAVIIFVGDIGLAIFGFLLFKNKQESSSSSEQIPIVYKKN